MTTDAPTATEQLISIGTWNMDHWRRTLQQRRDGWAYLRTPPLADVMLLQESVVPTDLSRDRFVHRELGWHARVGLSCRRAERRCSNSRDRHCSDTVRGNTISMLGSQPGTVIVAQVELAGVGPVTCISVYGAINVYAQTTMLRVIADLIPLFDSSHGTRVVLGGDFNVTTASKADTAELARHRAILAAVESLGLVNLATIDAVDRRSFIANCPCGGGDDCRHLRTYGHNPGTQLDWLYATPELAKQCVSVEVDHQHFGTLSDHAPIVAKFRIGQSTGRVLDPDSFLLERVFSEMLDETMRSRQACP